MRNEIAITVTSFIVTGSCYIMEAGLDLVFLVAKKAEEHQHTSWEYCGSTRMIPSAPKPTPGLESVA